MEFGPVPLASALGAVLAHSVALGDGRLRKGAILTETDLARLAGAGIAEITVARLGPGDVQEDAAAMTLAEALVRGAWGLSLRPVGTGRVNIHAEAPGLAEVMAERIHAVNRTHPMLTVATVSPWQRMAAGEMVATVKVIAYGVDAAAVAAAAVAGEAALGLKAPVLACAALIQTKVVPDDGDKGHRVTEARLQRLAVRLQPKLLVPHQPAPLAEAIRGAVAAGAELVLILTGSATSDIGDVAPSALRAAGGEVLHFGMPVDPGNLLFLGRLGKVAVIGLPGCARSPALNGADWVMERVICGVEVGSAEIMAMGVGGLLKEIPTRGRPREATA